VHPQGALVVPWGVHELTVEGHISIKYGCKVKYILMGTLLGLNILLIA
jgi:hypothetical protein